MVCGRILQCGSSFVEHQARKRTLFEHRVQLSIMAVRTAITRRHITDKWRTCSISLLISPEGKCRCSAGSSYTISVILHGYKPYTYNQLDAREMDIRLDYLHVLKLMRQVCRGLARKHISVTGIKPIAEWREDDIKSVAGHFCSQRNKILQARLEKRGTITIATGAKDRIAPRQFNSVPNMTATYVCYQMNCVVNVWAFKVPLEHVRKHT